jgi:hypothetical protein
MIVVRSFAVPRQRYLPTFAHLNYSVGALVLKENPQLSAAVGQCIAIWSYVDNEMGNLFGLLLGTESDAALEVFLSLRQLRTQLNTFRAAAKHRLEGKELLAFNAMLHVYGSLEAERNDLAHGCFGICPKDPTILFWISAKDHVWFQTEALSKESRGEIAEDRHTRLKENMYVYRLSDLEGVYKKMEEFWWATFYFNGYLRDPNSAGRGEEFRRLCSFPQIHQAMSQKPNTKT